MIDCHWGIIFGFTADTNLSQLCEIGVGWFCDRVFEAALVSVLSVLIDERRAENGEFNNFACGNDVWNLLGRLRTSVRDRPWRRSGVAIAVQWYMLAGMGINQTAQNRGGLTKNK